MNEIPTLHEASIKPWFDKLALIDDCVSQVQKDLGSYGIHITYSGKQLNAYDELFEQLQPQIEMLIKRNTSLAELLYRIDVDEQKVKALLKSNANISHSLTQLILWRELQKVVTRFILKQ